MRNRSFQIALSLLAASLMITTTAQVASAHPLGNFTINHYSRLELSNSQWRLLYIVDRAEVPAFQERAKIDANQDGQISSDERDTYLNAERIALQQNLQLSLNQAPLSLRLAEQHIEFPTGQGGLLTQRITLQYIVDTPVSLADAAAIHYADNNFSGRLGWKEIVVRADAGVTLSANAPTEDRSNGLTQYPQDMLNSPLNVGMVDFTASPNANAATANPIASATAILGSRSSVADPFADLINLPELTLGTALIALGLAFVWGAAHALSPGHGKTIVAAYLIGQRATVKHALFLGITTTITHTTGVFALGLITLFASQYILPEKLYPWLEVISGALVVVLGVSLLGNRVAGLLRPATTPHEHAHDDFSGMHDHGDGRYHSHTPPAQVGWRNLLALGISGGLLPCPSALVVMLSAIALQRVGFGLLLILVFSMGLAGVLIAIGVTLVHASKFVDRLSNSRLAFAQPILRVAPVFSALVITLAGLAITVRAVALTPL